jgi:LmbE family N-acetylglucosaminyl deacetylase
MGAVEAGARPDVNPLHLTTGDERLDVLCLGAHSDDIEIGAGASLLTLGERYSALTFHWVVLSADGKREEEAHLGAELFAPGAKVEIHSFPDARLPMHLDSIKDLFVDLGHQLQPDLILTHSEHDRHQDHRVVNALTWQTFRDHLILEYEIPKFDGDLVTPNLYVEITEETADAKVRHLTDAFVSQTSKPWFEAETFLGLMRLRGIECRSRSGFAEGFHVRKVSMA